MLETEIKVGIGVIIEKNNQVLLGQRINSHGAHTWAPPGGHLEFGETPEQCAMRETLEETGLVISDCEKGIWTNDYFEEENKHYVTLYVHAQLPSYQDQVTPTVMEPNKCLEWRWFSWDNLPNPLFLSFENLVKAVNTR